MNGRDLLKAIGEAEDRYVLEAASDAAANRAEKRKKIIFGRILPAAAAVCLISVGAVLSLHNGLFAKKADENGAMTVMDGDTAQNQFPTGSAKPTQKYTEAFSEDAPDNSASGNAGIIGSVTYARSEEAEQTLAGQEETGGVAAPGETREEMPVEEAEGEDTGFPVLYTVSAGAEETEGTSRIRYTVELFCRDENVKSIDMRLEPYCIPVENGRTNFEVYANLAYNEEEGTIQADIGNLRSGQEAVLLVYQYDDSAGTTLHLHCYTEDESLEETVLMDDFRPE